LRAGEHVIVFDTSRRPGQIVGHQWGHFHRADLEDGWLRSEIRTACGRLLHAAEWRELPPPHPPYTEQRVEYRADHSYLRFDVLQLVGRLCARCHPGDPSA
jgi:hypothetical protein